MLAKNEVIQVFAGQRPDWKGILDEVQTHIISDFLIDLEIVNTVFQQVFHDPSLDLTQPRDELAHQTYRIVEQIWHTEMKSDDERIIGVPEPIASRVMSM
jgi:hypothetical protein